MDGPDWSVRLGLYEPPRVVLMGGTEYTSRVLSLPGDLLERVIQMLLPNTFATRIQRAFRRRGGRNFGVFRAQRELAARAPPGVFVFGGTDVTREPSASVPRLRFRERFIRPIFSHTPF